MALGSMFGKAKATASRMKQAKPSLAGNMNRKFLSPRNAAVDAGPSRGFMGRAGSALGNVGNAISQMRNKGQQGAMMGGGGGFGPTNLPNFNAGPTFDSGGFQPGNPPQQGGMWSKFNNISGQMQPMQNAMPPDMMMNQKAGLMGRMGRMGGGMFGPSRSMY